ncbi:MAG: glycoside hydrolase family 9 protein [Candidatus Thiodiazotropha sp. (ex Epidulcina cf. delphinae)]|nr:glycoside hydrolase family 9 protein [Candidatus Thiodiazotropha sp. (ex Epidulcina cf. delphinae)]
MAWYFYEAQRSGPLPKFDGDLPFHDPATGSMTVSSPAAPSCRSCKGRRARSGQR